MPGEGAINMAAQQRLDMETPEEEKRTTGILSMLAERFREHGDDGGEGQNSIVVLPFVNFGGERRSRQLYGYALADALAARLAKVPSLVVRPSSALMDVPTQQLDPLSVGGSCWWTLCWRELSALGEGLRPELAAAGCGGAESCGRAGRSTWRVRFDRGADGDLRRGVCELHGFGGSADAVAGDERDVRWGRMSRRSICRRGRC
jgi:hypothetical protein